MCCLQKTARSNHSAFTLVEMLIVIGIIAALAALILPALSSARASARETACLNNMKQIGMGMTQYYGIHRYLPVDSYETAAGERLGEAQTNMLWSGAYRVKRGLGLMIPAQVPSPKTFFEEEATLAKFAAPQGWRRLDEPREEVLNWLNPAQNVASSYLYRQDFGNRVVKERENAGHALVTEYTFLSTDPQNDWRNHGGRGIHVLFNDGHAKWFGPTEEELVPFQWPNLAAIDAGTGLSGWESRLDPLFK